MKRLLHFNDATTIAASPTQLLTSDGNPINVPVQGLVLAECVGDVMWRLSTHF